jgi:hypothetical protein
MIALYSLVATKEPQRDAAFYSVPPLEQNQYRLFF